MVEILWFKFQSKFWMCNVHMAKSFMERAAEVFTLLARHLTFLLSDFCSTGLNNLGTFSVFRLIGNIKKHAILDPFTHSNLAGLIDMLLLFINYNVFN